MPWYIYNSGSIGNPNSFTLTTTAPYMNCPNPNNFLCAIQAADNNQKPILTFDLVVEIGNAVNNRSESTNVLLRATQ